MEDIKGSYLNYEKCNTESEISLVKHAKARMKDERILKKSSSPKKCTHPWGIQDLDEFVSSAEQFWRNVALLYIICSPMNPLQ